MTRLKADKGQKQHKALNETDDQAPAASESVTEPDAEPIIILSAIQRISKMMANQFNCLEASLASTHASLVSLGNRIQEVENANSDYDRRLCISEQTCQKMQSKNVALYLKMVDLEARSGRQNIKIIGLSGKD